MKVSAPSVATPSPITYGRIRSAAPAEIGGSTNTPSATPSATPAASVEKSGFLSRLQESTRNHPFGEVRADRVAAARADIAAGTLGNETDMNAAVGALMADL